MAGQSIRKIKTNNYSNIITWTRNKSKSMNNKYKTRRNKVNLKKNQNKKTASDNGCKIITSNLLNYKMSNTKTSTNKISMKSGPSHKKI